MSNIEKRKSVFKKIAKQSEINEADDNFVKDVSNADDIDNYVSQYADYVIDQILNDI